MPVTTRLDPFADIVVAGAGPAGAAFALAAKRALGALVSVTLADPALALQPRCSLRAVAIAPDVRTWLAGLGAWDDASAQPIRSMVISDGRPGALPHPEFLTFNGAREPDGALAHMAFADDLRAALLAGCRTEGVALAAVPLTGFMPAPFGLTVEGGDGESIRTRLLVAADGRHSRLRHAARVQTVGGPYRQSGIVATLRHTIPHEGRAVQHFLPSGPLALLPLPDDTDGRPRTSIVWTEASGEAARLVGLPETGFLAALLDRIGHEHGSLALADPPVAVPLALSLARRLTAPHFSLVGDAARVVHPLAGQGLNVGLRDAAALAARVTAAAELGLDPGSAAVLDAYARDRRFDATALAALTDSLNRLFSNDRLPLRTIRDIGLGLVDRAPWLKRSLIAGATRMDPPRRGRAASLSHAPPGRDGALRA